MIALATLHGAVLVTTPSMLIVAVGLWWSSNAISHNFIHRPFFVRRPLNWLFSAYLSVLLGIPQPLWRDRHLAHHEGRCWHLHVSAELAVHMVLVVAVWTTIVWSAPAFFFLTYLPGYIGGLALCALHGHYEHARGGASHYGKLYNVLFFNDGYHIEHHANPALHWTRLPECHEASARASVWPAPLRWMEGVSLQALERFVLKSPSLQRFVLKTHARAFRCLIPSLPPVKHVAIVGGGLFPRTALILRALLPSARLTIVDASRANLDRASELLGAEEKKNIEFLHARYEDGVSWTHDLMVIPLSFDGDRRAVYERLPAPAVIVHDWIWHARGTSRIVSVALLKRINLVRR